MDSDVPLNRDEAARLAEDAVDAEARQRATSIYPDQGAEMEVRPSLNALQVIRLLAAAPAVEPAAGPDGAGIDDFARRYAASRGLAYPQERQPAWRDPGPWFLATLNITRSRGLMTGGAGSGQSAEVWYAEGARLGRGGSRDQWIVARYLIMQAHRAGSVAVAVRRKRGLGRPGPPSGLTGIPRGLPPASVGDVRFRLRYAVAAAAGTRSAARAPGPGACSRTTSPPGCSTSPTATAAPRPPASSCRAACCASTRRAGRRRRTPWTPSASARPASRPRSSRPPAT